MKNNRPLLMPLLLLLFIISSCSHQETITPQQNHIETVAINEAVDFFNLKASSNSAKPANPTYVIPHLADIAQEEISNSDALLTVIRATTIYEEHYSRILLLKINNEIQSIVFSMYPSGASTQEQFSGEIIITDIAGNFLNGYRVRDGEFVAQFRKTATAGKTAVAAKNNNVVCPDHGECTEDSTCVLCLQELEEVVVTGNLGNNGGPIPFIDLNDFPGIDEGGAGGPDMGMGWDYGPGDGMAPEDDDEENVEDQVVIDSTFANTKAECVYNKLKELNGTFFSNMIANTFGNSKEAHIKFEVGNIPADDDYVYNARTYPSYNGNGDRYFRIRLDNGFLNNASTIEIALALIHETIHAELLERCIQSGLVLNISPNGSYSFQNYGNPTILNNLTIFNTVTTYYKNLGGGNPQWNHDQFNIFGLRESMAQNLIQIHPWLDDMNDSFINYINSDPVIDSLQQILDNLAWEGLEGTQEYLDLTPEQKSKKEYAVQQVKSNYTHDCN